MADFDWNLSEGDRRIFPALVYLRLKETIEETRDLLVGKRNSSDIKYVSWLTRNLVELRVWVAYCSLSEANAQEFYDDSLRDLIELNRKVPGMDADTQASLGSAATALPDFKPAHKFKDIREAAEAADMLPFYSQNFKTLSKFAHPTAVSVMARVTSTPAIDMCREIGTIGQNIACTALENLESSLLSDSYRKYGAAIANVAREHPELGVYINLPASTS